jgi:hypothetical protein
VRPPRVCEECFAEYTPRASAQRWCGACAEVETACGYCGRCFRRPRRISRAFCSRSCANASNARRGADHPSYNGGLSLWRTQWRWVIYCRDGSKVLFSRAVMAAHIGRLLRPDEIVHHLNGDTTDDRIENLLLTDRSEHARLHDFGSLGRRGPMGGRA